MAVMPGAQFLNAATSSGMTRYDIVCIHTIVGYAPAHAAHFSTRWDGHIFQSRDTRYRSAANLDGNYRIISIENEDHGPAFGSWSGSNVPGFTEQQIEAIAQICAWAHRTHGVPLVLCPDSKPGSRGIAYHRQGCDGNFGGMAYGGRVSGGELWSSAFGKVCPGDRRIRQVIERIIPRARVIAGLDEGDELNEAQNAALGDLWQAVVSPNGESYPGSNLSKQLGYVVERVAEVGADVDELKSIVSAPVTPEVDYDLLADKVAARLSALRFEAGQPGA